MAEFSENIPALMTEIEFSSWLNLASSTVRNKARDGVFVKDGKYYDVAASVRNYLAQLRETASKVRNTRTTEELDAAKLAKEQATAEKIELANAKARGLLVDSAAVEREWSSVLRDVRSAVLAVPSRIGGKFPHLSAHDLAGIEAEIKAALESLAEEIPDEFEY